MYCVGMETTAAKSNRYYYLDDNGNEWYTTDADAAHKAAIAFEEDCTFDGRAEQFAAYTEAARLWALAADLYDADLAELRERGTKPGPTVRYRGQCRRRAQGLQEVADKLERRLAVEKRISA